VVVSLVWLMISHTSDTTPLMSFVSAVPGVTSSLAVKAGFQPDATQATQGPKSANASN